MAAGPGPRRRGSGDGGITSRNWRRTVSLITHWDPGAGAPGTAAAGAGWEGAGFGVGVEGVRAGRRWCAGGREGGGASERERKRRGGGGVR